MAIADHPAPTERAARIAADVERFVYEVVVPYERDPRGGAHGPAKELVVELRARVRAAGLMTPHILPDGGHLTHRETALVLKKSGLSPLGPVALNTMAPDEVHKWSLAKKIKRASRR